uniref:Lipase_3 domain-containing protein n=1 Tax=Caenorhabditis tropicalis TaxID=1561998 RepID=A0A1I7UFC8_9PELO
MVSTGVIAKTDENCLNCVARGKEWCSSMKSCDVLWCPSEHSVFNKINCPQEERDSKYEYNDDFIRKKILITTAAVNSNQPQRCFDNQMPSMQVYNTYDVNCSSLPPAVPCFAYTAVDSEQKVIVVSFRGTQNNLQLAEELITYFYNGMQVVCKWYASGMQVVCKWYASGMQVVCKWYASGMQVVCKWYASGMQVVCKWYASGMQVVCKCAQRKFSSHGNIFSFFYDAFFFLWEGGLHEDILQLQTSYPGYELWINGHSLGGALASVAASYLVDQKIWRPENIKLVTMGQPRTGDYDYALWHDQTFPYSFRIVHNRDIVPHIPPQLGPGYSLYHHRTEIWYPNDMEMGAEFQKCESADGYYCSATLDFNLSYDDHGLYFVKEMPAWGGAGCPTLWLK